MNYTDILASLSQASAFDLFRLRAAIDRVLDQPGWIVAVQSRQRIGMTLEYFDPQDNRVFKAQLLEIRRKQVVVRDLETGKRWLVSCAALNLDGADVEIREQPKQGLSRQSLAVGDTVGFLDREQRQRSGRIIRLNDRTVTIQVGSAQWRVAYEWLHRVVESVASDGELPELGVLDGEARLVDHDDDRR